MKYKLIQPIAELEPFVKEIGVISCDDPSNKNHTMKFFADGCPGIIYSQSRNSLILSPGNKKLAKVFLHGQTVKPIEILAVGPFKMIVFFLYPHVVKSLFGFNANEITDDCIDVKLLTTSPLNTIMEQMLDEVLVQEQITILSNYLLHIIRKNKLQIDPIVHYATTQIIRNNGDISINDLYKELQLSERTLERKFEHNIGVSPRMFARVCKFQTTLNQINNLAYSKLTDVAYDNGFADQSHLIKTFKEFTGLTPKDYVFLNFQNDPIHQEITIFS